MAKHQIIVPLYVEIESETEPSADDKDAIGRQIAELVYVKRHQYVAFVHVSDVKYRPGANV